MQTQWLLVGLVLGVLNLNICEEKKELGYVCLLLLILILIVSVS